MRMHLIRRLFINHIDMRIRWRFLSRNSIHVYGYVFIIPSLYVQAYLKSNNSSISYIISSEIVWGWCIQDSSFFFLSRAFCYFFGTKYFVVGDSVTHLLAYLSLHRYPSNVGLAEGNGIFSFYFVSSGNKIIL